MHPAAQASCRSTTHTRFVERERAVNMTTGWVNTRMPKDAASLCTLERTQAPLTTPEKE